MNSAEIEAVLREKITATLHMSLATCVNNTPWVCEVHFAYDDNLNLYFRSKPSRRHSEEIASNSNVAGNIVKQHELGESVVGLYYEGTAELLQNIDETSAAYICMNERGLANPEAIEEAKNPEAHQFYKITIKNWYIFGRFGAPNGQKYKLEWTK